MGEPKREQVPPLREGSVRLKDGRRLAFAESGDPGGMPVVFFHGNPGSRYMRCPDDSLTYRLGVRLITPDRPGYGHSDYQPGRTLVDCGSDIEQLANMLGLGRFALLGVSAGGPYTAACAWHLGERITRAAIVSGSAPFDRRGAMKGVNRDYKNAYSLAGWPEWLLHPIMALHDHSVRSNPKRAMMALLAHCSAEDRAALADPGLAAQMKGWRLEATRQGVSGMRREAHILVSPWGFRLEEIRPEVHLWYWEGDTIVPQQMGHYLASRIPRSVPHFLPRGGHFSLFTNWKDILAPLAVPE